MRWAGHDRCSQFDVITIRANLDTPQVISLRQCLMVHLVYRLLHLLKCLDTDNILTEKVTDQVKDVVAHLSKINGVGREFRWSDADQQRLNHLNAEAKKQQT